MATPSCGHSCSRDRKVGTRSIAQGFCGRSDFQGACGRRAGVLGLGCLWRLPDAIRTVPQWPARSPSWENLLIAGLPSPAGCRHPSRDGPTAVGKALGKPVCSPSSTSGCLLGRPLASLPQACPDALGLRAGKARQPLPSEA